MNLSFALIATLTLCSAVAAMSLRNLIHCALALTLTFIGLAAAFLMLDAQFVGFAQILVYTGAVAILILFSILLTRGTEPPTTSILSPGWGLGLGVALLVFALLCAVVLSSRVVSRPIPGAPEVTVRQIGDQLMTRYILPLEVVGLLLTVALIGAVLIAMQEGKTK